MGNKIIINKDELASFAEDGGKLLFKAEAENQLVNLLEMKEFIDNLIEETKNRISESGKMLHGGGFQGVLGARVRALYRFFGERYTYDKERLEKVLPFIKEFTVRKVNSEYVDAYIKNHGKLPEGIIEKERVPQLSLSLTKPKLEHEDINV